MNNKDNSCHNEYVFPSLNKYMYETATLEGALCYERKRMEI